MRTAIVTLGVCAALCSAACNKKNTAPPPPELAVTLLDPGQGPRQTLRYAIAADTSMKSLLDIHDVDAAVKQPDDAEDAFGVRPGFTLLLHAGPTVALPNGTRYVLRVSKAKSVVPEGATERQTEEAQEGVNALRGLRGRFDINARGIVVDADVPWSQGQERIHPRVAITIGNVRSSIATIPLPDEPVGIGAAWEVRRSLRIWSARVSQTTRYELVDRQEGRFRVAITIHQTAEPQVADLNPNLEMHVRGYELRAKGQALVDSSVPLALEAEMQSTSAADIALVSPEKTEPLMASRRSVMKLKTKVAER